MYNTSAAAQRDVVCCASGGCVNKQLQYQMQSLVLGYDGKAVLTVPTNSLVTNSLGVIGHNGAGKSTFIKATLGLLAPIEGTLQIKDGEKRLVAEQDLAYCPETGSVFLDLRVEEYLKLWSRLRYQDKKFYMREGAKYLDCLEITPLLRKFGRELSKGQKRRVQTAIGFMLKPKLYLFDEPFDGLDVRRTADLSALLAEHKETMGFIISSHRMDVIERMCDTLAVLDQGTLLHLGPTSQVIKELQTKDLKSGNLTDAFTEFLSRRSVPVSGGNCTNS
jgi:ABC-2 type transport system ATP-binding protein